MRTERKTLVKMNLNAFFLLGTVFLVLKLASVQPFSEWPWWLVLSPFWVCVAVPLALTVLIIIGAIVAFVFSWIFMR